MPRRITQGIALAAALLLTGGLASSAEKGRQREQASTPGGRLYDRYCAPCHGADGKPLFAGAPDFSVGPYVRTLSDERIVAKLRSGGATMPSFARVFKPAQMQAVAAHTRSLGK